MPTSGFVYFLVTENYEYVKIGCTSNLNRRIRRLSIQLPFKVSLFHSLQTDDMHWLESFLHDEFKACRANGEWFRIGAGKREDIEISLEHYLQYDIWDRQDQVDLERDNRALLEWSKGVL